MKKEINMERTIYLGKVICLLKGYLRIQIKGREPIRFLNLCKNRNIILWDIQPEENSKILMANIHIKDFFLLHEICKKTGTRATVLQKNGMPFFMPVVKKRMIGFGMVILLLGYLWMMSFSIWNIELTGNHMISDEVIMNFLTEKQVCLGIKKNRIPIEELEFAFREQFPNITWIDISITGTKLEVSLQENKIFTESQNVKSITGSNLVSDKEGTILSMITRKGVPLVKTGDVIQKGDLLVQGKVPIVDENAMIIKYHIYDADATIMLLTQEHIQRNLSKTYTKKIYTGREKHNISFIMNQHEIKLPCIGTQYEMEEQITQMEQCRIGDNFYLPYYRCDTWIREYRTMEVKYSEEQMKARQEELIGKIMLSFTQKGVQILQKNVRIKESLTDKEIIADFQTCEQVGVAVSMTEEEKTVEVQETAEAED